MDGERRVFKLPGMDESGIRCRKCGCCDLRVAQTFKQAGGFIMRKRVCRHCGERITTTEREVVSQ